MREAEENKVHLAHELVVEPFAELLGAHARDGAEMHMPRAGDDGIDLSKLRIHGLDRVLVHEVHRHVAGAAAGADNLVAA